MENGTFGEGGEDLGERRSDGDLAFKEGRKIT